MSTLTRPARIESVLFELDGPQVLLARDAYGVPYVVLLAEHADGLDQFAAVPVSPERLADVNSGRIDLRSAFIKPELGEVFAGTFLRIDGAPTLQLHAVESLPESWLPEADLFLPDLVGEEPATAADIIAEAVQKNTAVVELKLDPPEAYTEAKINAERLADALRVFQNFARHAYTKASASLSENWKRSFGGSDAHIMQVFGFAPGSFSVHLQAQDRADLSGMSALGLALAKIDELTANIESPEAVLSVVQANRGHVVSAYEAMLRFVVEQGTPVRYSWAQPGSYVVHERRITPEAAARLYELLVSRKELSVEEVVVVGAFTRVVIETGQWTIKTAEGDISGELAEGTGNLLSGVTVGTTLYRADCEERLEEVAGSGRQKTRILMRLLNKVTTESLLPDPRSE